MYKILIKKTSTTRNLFEPYIEESVTPEGEAVTAEFQTDDLTELADKYKELLGSYNTNQIKLIEELDAEIVINVTDN